MEALIQASQARLGFEPRVILAYKASAIDHYANEPFKSGAQPPRAGVIPGVSELNVFGGGPLHNFNVGDLKHSSYLRREFAEPMQALCLATLWLEWKESNLH